MYSQPASRHLAAGPSMTSIIDSDGLAVAAVDDRIQFARKSRCFADEARVTPEQFPKWLDGSNARPELSCSLHWLQTLLPGKGDEAVVRSGIATLDRLLSGPLQPKQEELFELYGPVKRNLLTLCNRLEDDRRATTIAAACREFHLVFGAAQGLGKVDVIARAIESALSAVAAQSSTVSRRCDADMQGPVPVVQPRPTSIVRVTTPTIASTGVPDAEPLPKTGDVELATILASLGAGGIRELYARLVASFDRLIDLLPKARNASLQSRLIGMVPKEKDTSLKRRLIEWRDRYATPPTRFHRVHAEMLYGGHLAMTALCNVLEGLNSDKRRTVFEILARKLPGRRNTGSEATILMIVVVEAEGIHDNTVNPHEQERRSLLERSTLLDSPVTEEEISDLMVGLGLALDWGIDDASSKLHPVRNNAAWRMCLENVLGPLDEHPLANVGKATPYLA
jgi:hypothetical protein